jgi:predicted ATPase
MALPDPGILVTEENLVSLDPAKFWCDVFDFHRLSASSQTNPDCLEEAVRLYRDPFLSGFDLPESEEFEHWISEERSSLENQYLGILSQLNGIYAARQDYSKAITCAQRYLATDELAEEIHRQLIMYYALAGLRTKALRQFETCVSVLEQELGADPLPETRAIYQAVLEERLTAIQPELVEKAPPAWSQGLSLDVPLIGRSAPYSVLETAFERTRAGQSSVVLISGEPGIGKSRLLHDFMKKCWEGSLVLFGAGQRGEQTVSYHPIVEALKNRLTSVPLSLPPYWLAEVSRLLPELVNIYPQLPRPLSLKGEEARIRLFEALGQCVMALQAASGSVLLCLDDLHWFDPTSLSWITYLARKFLTKNSRLMVVGTYRSEDYEKIKDLRDGLARQGLLKEIKLAGLSQEDILELLHHLFNSLPGKEDFAARLQETTGGNPLFVLEMLRALSEELNGSGDLHRLVNFPLPEGVREAIDRRLERLNAKSRQVLEAGAVIGTAFDFQTVRMTSGRNEFDTSDGLENLTRRQLIQEDKQQFRFCHDLVYRTILMGISPMRLQLLHSRAARALEKLHPDSITSLAYHFEAAGDQAKAFTYYQRSARQAETLFAWPEAVDQYGRMVQILDKQDPYCSKVECLEQRCEILKESARLNHLLSRLPDRDHNLEQLESFASQSHDKDIELRALVQRTYYMHQDGDYRGAANLVEKGLILAEHLHEDSIRCSLLAQLGFSLQFLGQPYQAISALEKAEIIADARGDIEMRAQILSRMGFIHSLFGYYRQALDCQLESYACYEQLNDHYNAARNLPQIGHLYINLGQFEEAHQALTEILALAKKAGVSQDEAHAFMGLGGYHLCKGDYFLALGCFEQALAGFRNTRAQNLIASAHASMGMVFYHLGNLQEAHASLERGLSTARQIGHRMRIVQALVQLSLVEIASHNLIPARQYLLEATAVAKDAHCGEDLSAALSTLARLERLEGNLDQAKNLASEALAVTQGPDLAPLEVFARMELAFALLAAGEPENALSSLRPALLAAGSVHQRWLGTEEIFLAGAQVLRQLGQADAAESHIRQAQEIIHAKASAIPDPAMRQIFLAKFDPALIITL